MENHDSARAQGSGRNLPERHSSRPTPDALTGELLIDPEIVLKAKGFNLEIEFFYGSLANANDEYGKGRSASTRA